tara:strand:- start:1396 stop:1599 length:204 start_codon:yes stop_codon:yes gene_type:complete
MSDFATALPPIISLLKSKAARKQITAKINDAIDIPMISEETEGKVIKSVIKCLVRALEEFVEEDDDE